MVHTSIADMSYAQAFYATQGNHDLQAIDSLAALFDAVTAPEPDTAQQFTLIRARVGSY